MSDSGEPITKCPVCRYNLTGLPKNHTCPECGFEYDEQMRVWVLKNPAFVESYAPTICFFTFMFVTFIMKFIPGTFAARFVRVSDVVLDALLAYTLLLLFITLRSHAFIVVSSRALIYRLALGRVREIAWHKLTYVGLDPHPRLLTNGKSRRFFLPVNFLRRIKREILLTAIRDQWSRAKVSET